MSTNLQLLRKPEAVACLLGLITLALFWPATRFGFIELDDDAYVSENPYVQQGLTGSSVAWATTEVSESYWLPLTWLSFILDRTVQGSGPGGFHRTNVLLHAANVVLLFLLGYQLIGQVWGSALVAALFGWHPLRVEAVVWISSRKDVLSTFFGLLALLAYVRFVQRRQRNTRAEMLGDYLWILLAMIAGLMAKPMWVMLPFVLLLLDFWPLKRFGWRPDRRAVAGDSRLVAPGQAEERPDSASAQATSDRWRFPVHPFHQLLLEKVPLLLVSVIFIWLTLATHQTSGSLHPIKPAAWVAQLADVPANYCRYLGKIFWPTELAVRYPPHRWPPAQGLALASLLATGMAACRWGARRWPWVLVGWFWFLGTFVPIIGLVRIGTADFADRFTYVPSIGIALMAAGALASICPGRFGMVRNLVAILLLASCAVATLEQMHYWRDGETLFRRTLQVTGNNASARNALGRSLEKQQRWLEAIEEYRESLRIAPDFGQAHANLGNVLGRMRRFAEAAPHFQAALQGTADDAKIHSDYGSILCESGQAAEGVRHLQEAVRLNPHLADAHFNLGHALLAMGHPAEALEHFAWATRINPGDDAAQFEAGRLYLARGNRDQARSCFEAAFRRQPGNPDYRLALQGITGP